MPSYTEFNKLNSILLGKAHDLMDITHIKDVRLKSYLEKIIYETNVDLDNLENFLKKSNINVVRPEKNFSINGNILYENVIYPTSPLAIRDMFGIFGKKLICTQTKSKNRYLETHSIDNIFSFDRDFRIDTLSYDDGRDYKDLQLPFYHTANLLKCGNVIFSSLSNNEHFKGKGNILGETLVHDYLKNQGFDVIKTNFGGHIDGKIALLRPGLCATWHEKYIPNEIQHWDKIIIPDTHTHLPIELRKIRKEQFYIDFVKKYLTDWIGYCDESVFDINILSLDEKTAISGKYRKDIYAQFKNKNIELIHVPFRHCHFWDGGLHCITLDLDRDGNFENYIN